MIAGGRRGAFAVGPIDAEGRPEQAGNCWEDSSLVAKAREVERFAKASINGMPPVFCGGAVVWIAPEGFRPERPPGGWIISIS